MSIARSLRITFPELIPSIDFPEDVATDVFAGNVSLRSSLWVGSKFSRVRLCELDVPEKFMAETLVIYPNPRYDFPIFGCEYLRIGGKKFFGGADFHPISKRVDYAKKYLSDFPDSTKEDSKFYDLSKYFSSKFWLKKDSVDFYPEYNEMVDQYLARYRLCVEEAQESGDSTFSQIEYNNHMAENDPARGILKAYFSAEFAEMYIHKFLFTNGIYQNKGSI
jgi:hypothetical protein